VDLDLLQVTRMDGCSRRKFCQATSAGLLILGVNGCGAEDQRLGTGGLENSGGNVGGGGETGTDGGGGDGGGGGSGGGGAGGSGGGGAGGTGGGGGSGGGQGSVDMAGQPPEDMAHGTSCTPGSTSAGNKSSYSLNNAKLISNKYIVVQDSGGFYAMTAVCPHRQCTINDFSIANKVVCDCHGASWSLDGTGGTSPASGTTLQHYALCIDASGNITITSTKVSATERY
jgi:nitrite reductase/ring-hydroxylating ferredoxin subunit